MDFSSSLLKFFFFQNERSKRRRRRREKRVGKRKFFNKQGQHLNRHISHHHFTLSYIYFFRPICSLIQCNDDGEHFDNEQAHENRLFRRFLLRSFFAKTRRQHCFSFLLIRLFSFQATIFSSNEKVNDQRSTID